MHRCLVFQSLNQKLEYLTTTFKPKAAPEKKGKMNRKEKAKEKERVREVVSKDKIKYAI